MSVSDNSGAIALPGPQSQDAKREAKLLAQEARQYTRAESRKKITRCTGERLLREEPRRFRLIASMRSNGLSIRETCRAALCDARTVASVERLEAQSTPTVKAKLSRGFGQLARMTLERLQEEVPTMNQAQLAVTAGIATDKFLTLSGEANQIIDVNVRHQAGNIFDKINHLASDLAKVVHAREVRPQALELTEA